MLIFAIAISPSFFPADSTPLITSSSNIVPRIILFLQLWLWQGGNCNANLIQNSQAVKKECDPQKGYGEKRSEIKRHKIHLNCRY